MDKWDYFVRDCHHLGLTCNCDHDRLLKMARAKEIGGKWRICYREGASVSCFEKSMICLNKAVLFVLYISRMTMLEILILRFKIDIDPIQMN